MAIQQRNVGDILVVDLRGSLTADESGTLRELMMSTMASGVRKVLLNLAHVTYIDSSGLATLVEAYARMTQAGGLLWLCHPKKNIEDLFSITKLVNLLPIFQSEESAVSAMRAAGVAVTCPRCGPEIWMRFDSADGYQRCRACQARFEVKLPLLLARDPQVCQVTSLILPTYETESIRVTPGCPATVKIDSRLDLFASESIADAVRLLSAPRHILYRLSFPDVTSSGLRALLKLCQPDRDRSRGAVSVGGLPETSRAEYLSAHTTHLFGTDEQAVLALGPDVQTSRIEVFVRIEEQQLS